MLDDCTITGCTSCISASVCVECSQEYYLIEETCVHDTVPIIAGSVVGGALVLGGGGCLLYKFLRKRNDVVD